jgi:hypothetical protein
MEIKLIEGTDLYECFGLSKERAKELKDIEKEIFKKHEKEADEVPMDVVVDLKYLIDKCDNFEEAVFIEYTYGFALSQVSNMEMTSLLNALTKS